MKSSELSDFLANKQIFKRNANPEKSGAIFDVKRVWQRDGDLWNITITDPLEGTTQTLRLRDFYDDLLKFGANRQLMGLYQPVK